MDGLLCACVCLEGLSVLVPSAFVLFAILGLAELGLHFLVALSEVLTAGLADVGRQVTRRNSMQLLVVNEHLRRKTLQNPLVLDCIVRCHSSAWIPVETFLQHSSLTLDLPLTSKKSTKLGSLLSSRTSSNTLVPGFRTLPSLFYTGFGILSSSKNFIFRCDSVST